MAQLSIRYKDDTFPVNDNILDNFSEIKYKYGSQVIHEGMKPEDTKTIYISRKNDDTIKVSVLWEYWKSMFSMEILSGEIVFYDWNIKDMIQDIVKASDEMAGKYKDMTEEEIESLEDYPVVTFHKPGQYSVETKRKKKEESLLETLAQMTESERQKMFDETLKIVHSVHKETT